MRPRLTSVAMPLVGTSAAGVIVARRFVVALGHTVAGSTQFMPRRAGSHRAAGHEHGPEYEDQPKPGHQPSTHSLSPLQWDGRKGISIAVSPAGSVPKPGTARR